MTQLPRVLFLSSCLLLSTHSRAADPHVGPLPQQGGSTPHSTGDSTPHNGGDSRGGYGGTISYLVPTFQSLHPAGQSLAYHGRPVDLALSPDHKTLYVKSNASLLSIDIATWKLLQELKLPDKTGASLTGLAVTPDGASVYLTTSTSKLLQAAVGSNRKLSWARKIDTPGLKGHAESFPCGLSLSPDSHSALVCQSMANSLAEIDLDTGKQVASLPVGNAPFGVAISPDGTKVYVSNWGGRRATPTDKTNPSAGTSIVVDSHGLPTSGTLSLIDPQASKAVKEIPVGLHPGALVFSPDGSRLYVANANSDTITILDTSTSAVLQTLSIKPDPDLPWGSSPNALCLSPDGKTLYVALGGNNAIAVVDLSSTPKLAGFIPTAWWPGAVTTDGKYLYIANTKGIGSRDPAAKDVWSSHSYWGTINKVPLPDASQLAAYTLTVKQDALIPQALRAWEKSITKTAATPVPSKIGDPSVIEHVLYIIKENRTYDQILGDMPKGNNDKNLCQFGSSITPNAHAIADQFVLLDNYYCNGVLSADGHAWATEGYANDYLERSFGAWARSYPYPGNDSLAFAPTGFIWDNALTHGLTFRNFGEFSETESIPKTGSIEGYKDYFAHTHLIKYQSTMALEPLRQYSNKSSPGWSLRIPDQYRADVFIKELQGAKTWPNLTILYLPNDHTYGTRPGQLTPSAMVADNDLAVGRVVEAVSHSPFWSKTCIFITEDDPQAGTDHVDGHRSVCLVVSPYTKRSQVVSRFYNQTGVLHTIERMLGLPPMNQMDSIAPTMEDCFQAEPDLRPYVALQNKIPLDTANPPTALLTGKQLEMAELSQMQNFEEPDRADENDLNKILWFATRGWDTRYPAELAGAHGRGLKKLHLKLDGSVRDDDD